MALAKAVTADQGDNIATLRFEGCESALHQRLLLQLQEDGSIPARGSWIEFSLGLGFALWGGRRNPDNITGREDEARVFY